MTWWADYMETAFELQTIGYYIKPCSPFYTKYPHIDGWKDGESLDIKKESLENHNCIEEQLWAIRTKLA